MWFENIFFHFIDCLFILLTISFAVQKPDLHTSVGAVCTTCMSRAQPSMAKGQTLALNSCPAQSHLLQEAFLISWLEVISLPGP